MNKEKIITEIKHYPFVLGGVDHTGWLPNNASIPKATAKQNIILNFEIIDIGESGYRLQWWTDDNEYGGDTWHETIEAAKRQALLWFKIKENAWQEPKQQK
jgi:hypothetical protein